MPGKERGHIKGIDGPHIPVNKEEKDLNIHLKKKNRMTIFVLFVMRKGNFYFL